MSGECDKCGEHTTECECDEYVDHPNHYRGDRFEVIDIIEDFQLGFNLGNAIKYVLRANKKENYIQDLRKAIWYLQREISNYENK